MIHYTCDRCKRLIDEQDVRYVLKLEAQATIDHSEHHDVDQGEQLAAIYETIERIGEDDSIVDEIYQQKKFDVCSRCFHEFMEDPLNVNQKFQVGYSQN